ncbi:SSI family serine proteinase inhibitor [Streptomyces griseoaurantiacus]|uniref:SSI family serine proteinase inhibitor n=1 Tax=Streptomyces griseoaurantiacus TaxID=68213 RepID=UPI0037B33E74
MIHVSPCRPLRPSRLSRSSPSSLFPWGRSLLAGAVALSGLAAGAVPADAHDRVGGDRLTVTVRQAGRADGTYLLRCHPGGGSHPDPGGACAVLDRRTTWGRDPFAPVPPDALCTMRYGGPATARVTGTWAGRPVDASYDRADGCEIARWDALVPLLPAQDARLRQ